MNPKPALRPRKKKPKGLFAFLRRSFFTGLLITVPGVLTLYLTWLGVNIVDGWMTALIPPRFHPQTYLPFSIPGMGLILAVALLIIIGAVGANVIVRVFMRMVENTVNRLPGVRGLYATIKQVVETIFSDRSESFQSVVMIEYPRKGLWVLGFATGEAAPEMCARVGKDLVNVFVPTTPNPTSGFLFFVPREDVIFSPVPTDVGVKLIFSAGITPTGEDEDYDGGDDHHDPTDHDGQARQAEDALKQIVAATRKP
ncbi:MAG: DUF502 domain-containing protein [Pseudomonadota bacterium]